MFEKDRSVIIGSAHAEPLYGELHCELLRWIWLIQYNNTLQLPSMRKSVMYFTAAVHLQFYDHVFADTSPEVSHIYIPIHVVCAPHIVQCAAIGSVHVE